MNRPKSPPAAAPDLSIVGDTLTIHPAGYTEDAAGPSPSLSPSTQHDDTSSSPERTAIGQMARFRESPLDFLREISLHVSGTGWRSYDHVIGQPIFYSGFSERMKGMVMRSAMLRAKIGELAERRVGVEEEEGLLGGMASIERSGANGMVKDERRRDRRERRRREIEASLAEVAETWTDDMICKMESKRFIRGAYYLVTQLLTRAYHQGLHVSSEEVLRLRAVAEEAAKNKQSIIFLPCHRSHVDYVSLQILCYRLGLALPVVVAGDNLNFPVVGPFLQHAGAMWIRRSFGDDQLYTTLVQSYIDTLLQNGHNFECFVEGGRSRTGKLLSPKFGILGYLLDSVMSGRVKDAIVCPVSTQYDKVIEVDSYISELLGQPKRKESLSEFLSASSILSLKLGRVDVRFHEPWSLRGFIDEQLSRLPTPIDDTTPLTRQSEVRLRILRTMGYRVLKEINDVSVVMPTALIGTVLLTLRGRGVGKSELIRRVEWLSERVKSQGGRVAHFAGLPTSTVVERGLEVLGSNLVGTVQGLPEETYYAVDRFQLSFYRNMTIHLFILPALVSAAMYTRVKLGGAPESQRISFHDLKAQVFFLSQLFRGEFIFPTEGLDTNLDHTLRALESDAVVTLTRSASGDGDDGGRQQIGFAALSGEERRLGRENFDFYCFLIWPFIEASWLGAVSLMMLAPPPNAPPEEDVGLDLKKVQDRAQLLGKTLYHQGDLSYFEAVNKETLKNAYQRFEEEGIIVLSKSRDSKTPTTVKIAREWAPKRDVATGAILPEGRLWQFAEDISQSRREGKNRRDGATVGARVLRLADVCGRELFEDERVAREKARVGSLRPQQDGPTDEEDVAGKARRRRRGIAAARANL